MADINAYNKKQHIEIMFADGRTEKINVKTQYLIPTIVKGIIAHHSHALCWVKVANKDESWNVTVTQNDTCVNVLQTMYNDRLIF